MRWHGAAVVCFCGKGGKGGNGGKGGKGGKGGNKLQVGTKPNTSHLPCFRFAEGKCPFGDNCRFSHSLSAKEKEQLKAKTSGMSTAKGVTTTAQVVNALKAAPAKKLSLADKMDELRTSGLSDSQIIKVASVLLESQ